MSEQTQLESSAPAPAPAPAPGYPFSVLRVLSTSLRVTKNNFVPFLVLATVLEVPGVLLQFGGGLDQFVVSTLVGTITSALMQAVVVYGVVMELQGARPSTGACIRAGFAQLGSVIGVTIVTTLAMFGAMLLLVVPGIIVFLMLYVTVPVTVVERLGIRAAMKRSRELTYGRKGDLFVIFIVAMIAAIPIYIVAGQLTTEAALVWRTLTSAFLGMFFAVTVGVAYIELRKLRDGMHIPDLASAFARFRK